MNLIDRYIARTILSATALVTLVIGALLFLMLFIGQVDDIGEGRFGVVKVLVYCVLMLPSRLYNALPVIALLGALAALGAMAAGSELVVIRASGVSMQRLAVSVAAAGLVIAVATAVLGAFAAPQGLRAASQLRDKARHGRISASPDNGLWLRSDGYVLRVGAVLPGGRIRSLDAYRVADDGTLKMALSAPSAQLRGHQLVVSQPEVTRLGQAQARSSAPDRLALPVKLDPALLRLAVTRPDELSPFGLSRYIRYLSANDIEAIDYRLAFWRDIVAPFTVWVLTIFALPFAFGSLRSASAGQRLFMGGLAGLSFFLVNAIMGSTASVYGVPAALAASGPTLLLTLATFYWMRRAN